MYTTGKYNRVGSKKGPLLISGAQKKFEEDSTFVYVPMFHVAGPMEEVKVWLQENHSDDSKKALETSYSTKSLKNKKVLEAFEKEIQESVKSRTDVSNARAEMKRIDLTVLTKLVKMYEKGKKAMTAQDSEKKPKDIKNKIKELSKIDKVLDVTKMKEDGSGSSKVKFSAKSKKKRLSQQKSNLLYNVVYSSDSPDVQEGLKNFLSLYGGFTHSQIERILDGVKEGSIINISPTRSPTRSTTTKGKRERVRSPARYVEVADDSD